MRFRAGIGVLAGAFAWQPLAFAHLLDTAPGADLDQVEVLRRPFDARLAHHFDAEIATRIIAAGAGSVGSASGAEGGGADGSGGVSRSGDEGADTLVLLLPGCGVPLADPPRLTVLGRFAGHVTRALAG